MSFEIGLNCELTNGPWSPKKYVPTQIAIQFSMIVEITSWAPVVALRNPAIPPQRAPARIASTMHRTMCAGTGDARPVRAEDQGRVGAGEVLALPADVEHPAAERERDREAAQDQRRHDQEGLLEVRGLGRPVAVAGNQPRDPRAVEDRPVGAEWVVAGRKDDEAADEEGESRRDDRDDEALRVDPGTTLPGRLVDEGRARIGRRGGCRLGHVGFRLMRRRPSASRPSSRARACSRARRPGTRRRSRPRTSRGSGRRAHRSPRARARRAALRALRRARR